MAEKRYYWLKMKEDFFNQKEIKKLRRIAGGDTYTVIYLKMLLMSLKDEGKLFFDGIEETFAEELALVMDEDVDNVKMTVGYLISVGLLKEVNCSEAELTIMPELIGSETSSALRVRRHRERHKILENAGEQQKIPEDTEGKPLHCNADVTNRNTDIEKRREEKREEIEKSNRYGEFQNVLLSDDEYQKIVERFPMDYQDRIEEVSVYVKQTGRKYKSHYATILAWARKNSKNNSGSSKEPNGITDDIQEWINGENNDEAGIW